MADESMSYRDAGVDIDEAQYALNSVKDAIAATHDERVLGGIGSFGGLFEASFGEMQRPVLVGSIDGVGTKTKVAAMAGDYSNIGRDIVNHCIDDILCQGARPLFFMDYFGCARLSGNTFQQVVTGAAEACREAGIPLIGGETAEMPGVYTEDEVDVVGAVTGVLDYENRLPKEVLRPGDRLVALASDGLHTNGFSLARRALFEYGGYSVRDELPGTDLTIGRALLAPHRCYYNAVYPLLQAAGGIKAIAHITGGGLPDNLPRVLPHDVQAVIDRRSWEVPRLFRFIGETGHIADTEMFRTFNMGVGMVLVVDADAVSSVLSQLEAAGETAWHIGELKGGPADVQIV
jgi:phosphoribosylformylglycinamidine cyclo-ligase